MLDSIFLGYADGVTFRFHTVAVGVAGDGCRSAMVVASAPSILALGAKKGAGRKRSITNTKGATRGLSIIKLEGRMQPTAY